VAAKWKCVVAKNQARYSGQVLTLSTLINPDNQPVGIVGYLSDITQRKEAEKN
jgi:PAS domain-containing protein